MTTTPPSIRHYFVDEGGDGVLFSRNGKGLVGTEGCSRFFILGLLDVPDPEALNDHFDELREQLLHDSYFRGVPSMQPEERKTALAFHAKDDLPEVRRDVFRILWATEGLRFFAVVAEPKEHAGLQAVDYFFWALQRLYERDEERYLVYLWDAFRLVHDIDDTRESTDGGYYTQKNPLTAAVLRWRKEKPGI